MLQETKKSKTVDMWVAIYNHLDTVEHFEQYVYDENVPAHVDISYEYTKAIYKAITEAVQALAKEGIEYVEEEERQTEGN